MEQEPGTDRQGKSDSVISRAIQDLLERHGVPEVRRISALDAATQLGNKNVRRRMSGETSWNVDEIRRLATHFDEPVFNLLSAMVGDTGQPAVLEIGGLGLMCTVWPGQALQAADARGPLIAVQSDGERPSWRVKLKQDHAGKSAYEVRRLVFENSDTPRVAVVDQLAATAEAIVQALEQKGLDAIPYSRPEYVKAALDTTSFDGYIVAWKMGDGDAREILELIRSRSPGAPLLLLVDQLDDQTEQRFEEITATYRAQLFEKPARTLSLLNALVLGLNSRALPG